MPAFDNNVKTAVQTHDISAETEHASDAITIGRLGLVDGLVATVYVTEVTAQAVGAVTFDVEVTTDGATYRNCGSVTVPVGKVQAKSHFSIPFGFNDILPMNYAAANIKLRVTSNIAAVVANADDFSWQAYFGPHMGAPGPYN